jgi:hypothetical protein
MIYCADKNILIDATPNSTINDFISDIGRFHHVSDALKGGKRLLKNSQNLISEEAAKLVKRSMIKSE